MFAILETVIGLSFVYLLLALVCTTANEWIAGARKLRARTLEEGIRELLGPMTDEFYDHPLIATLGSKSRKPSYIPAHFFSSAVLDILGGRHETPRERHAKDRGAGAVTALHVRSAMDALRRNGAAASPEDAAALEDWFAAAMDRTSGVYKRRVQGITVVVAAAVTILSNADTLQMIGVLWRSPTLRSAILEQARVRVAEPEAVQASYGGTSDAAPAPEEVASAELVASPPAAPAPGFLGQLIGWSSDFRSLNEGHCRTLQAERDRVCADSSKASDCQAVLRRIATDARCDIDGVDLIPTAATPGSAFVGGALFPVVGSHLFGWILTVIAISLGAAFWFDTLKRFVNLRGTGPVPADSKSAARA